MPCCTWIHFNLYGCFVQLDKHCGILAFKQCCVNKDMITHLSCQMNNSEHYNLIYAGKQIVIINFMLLISQYKTL